MIKINKEKIISYFIFVALATLFWFSTVLNKESVYTKNIWIELMVPDSLVLMENSKMEALVTLKGKGVDLLSENSYSESRPLKIPIPTDSGRLTKSHISKYLNRDLSKSNIDIEKIVFYEKALKIDKKITKTIPIKIDGSFIFENLYGLKSEITINPKRIKITGAQTYIDNILEWKTEKKVYSKITNTITEKIKLQKPKSNKISISESVVILNIPVEEYTEKKIVLPVKIGGNSINEINTLPSHVEVSFLIGLSKFNSVDTTDFTANIYIENNYVNESSYPVSIINKPKDVSIQYIRPNFVDIYLNNEEN